MSVAVDTSALIPALLASHEHHERALSALLRVRRGEAELVVPLPVLLESYAVLTRLPPPWRVAPEDAFALLQGVLTRGTRVAALDGPEAWTLLGRLRASVLGGGFTYDPHILACAKKAGATRLLTFNDRRFRRLDLGGIELVVP